jgi:CRISPR-associated protein Csx3
MGFSPSASTLLRLRSAADFNLLELAAPGGLRAQLLPTGTVYAFRHRETLLNQFLPGPAEDGLFRLLVRWTDPVGAPLGWAPLVGPGLDFSHDTRAATWRTTVARPSLACTTTLGLHPGKSGWAWRVRLRNTGTIPQRVDVLHAQDLGLADEAAVRNNEAYVSQYIDLLPVTDPQLGHVILARQNQSMAGGRRPWLGVGCAQGSAAYCTDGWQFFGTDHRLTGEPAAVRAPALPSQRLQYEFALAGLQSRPVTLAPDATTEIMFVVAYAEDHPAASDTADLAALHDLLPATWLAADVSTGRSAAAGTLFTRAPWLHGARPTTADWTAWFPGARRHEEADEAGHLLSFFHGAETHVVSRDKEAIVARPHGHILRSGDAASVDDGHFGLTCYAAGIFGAQSYLGNPSLARLLSVVRNQLNVARAGGQRVFLRHSGAWHQLGVPSAFAMEPGAVRWIYRLDGRVIEARVWCSPREPASFLELEVLTGPPAEFLITHQLALGSHEFDSAGELEVHDDGWIAALPAPGGFTAQHLPGTCFALAATAADQLAAHGGDELLGGDGVARSGPYACFQTKAVSRGTFIMLGVTTGAAALSDAVVWARAECAAGTAGHSQPPAAPLRLRGTTDPGIARLDEILPWFTHNAAIHFSAPHGLEQYGGGAWGVRDVCQGSVEWLLAAGEFTTVRPILAAVFVQQYAHHPKDPAVAGCWPQWFMFAPFRFIQQTHSHGDVCFWPIKALCDYVEASNDFAFLSATLGYTDPVNFSPTGPVESLWAHCDRVIAHCEARFIAGTALINYGDGDWDDTLQPADPAMRTRMVSAWTVGLAYQTFRQLAGVSHRAGESARAARLDQLLGRMRADFARFALPGGTVAGFLVHEGDGRFRPLLHPSDRVTGIRYRLLPMTRSVLAELLTPAEAAHHAALIEAELSFSDGVRLMSEPAIYQGGLEKLFKRAETAANVGREIGLQYVHAHIRYAEAMAKVGDADRLWQALQVVNPVGLERVVPGAVARQSNVYFSSSDADFADRVEAAARWSELRAGRVPVRGGWRLYSSGPGLYLHKIRSCLLGLRESFGDVVFDPVLPRNLDGLTAETHLLGRSVQLHYRVKAGTSAPTAITVNGTRLTGTRREQNPYRPGGLSVAGSELAALLRPADNRIEIEL